jgi:hypothetical protein
MKQALHIFKKDARYLRWELAALFACMALFVWAQTRHPVGLSSLASIVTPLLACLWAFICARLMQAEPIPGDRQFWITRPYEWRSLLAAKLLFIVAFLSIPLLLADAIILATQGFRIASNVPGLLWSVFLITVGYLLTFCAFATLMRSLTQWVLSAIVVVGLILALAAPTLEPWGGEDWMRKHGEIAILWIAALTVLLWQYKRRRTVLSIAVMAAGLLAASLFASYFPATLALELETRFSRPKIDPSSIAMAFRARTEPHSEQYRWVGSQLAIPVEVTGVTEGLRVISDRIHTTIEFESGEGWSPHDPFLQHSSDGYREILFVDRTIFEKPKDHPVRIRSTLYLTLWGPRSRVIQLGIRPVQLPGVGLCSEFVMAQDVFAQCVSPMREPSNLLVVKLGLGGENPFFAGTSYSPFPADSSIGPIHGSWRSAAANDSLTVLEPLAHFRRDLDLRGIYLADYQAVVPRYR